MSLTRAERVKYFDEYVASVDTTFRHPQVVRKLGLLGTRILKINAAAFLPNERNGQMHVPYEHKDFRSPFAVVPMSNEEAARSAYLVEPILAELGDWRRIGRRVVSSVSGVEVGTDDMIHWFEHESDEADPGYASPEGLKTTVVANTVVNFKMGDALGSPCYRASHAAMVVKADMLKGLNGWNQAGTVGHEEAHVLDILSNPVLYKMPVGGAGSELAGYHVGSVLYSMTGQAAATPRAFTQAVEQWRQQNMPEETPYAPNEEQLSVLRGWVVH